MDDIDDFFAKLKESIEAHSADLEKGKLFGPEYLADKVFSKSFEKVAKTLGIKRTLNMRSEKRNYMPKPANNYGNWQTVDYVYYENEKQPRFYLELETLDRAQLYLFCDISDEINENKLWYYLGTVKKHVDSRMTTPIPRYFVWLLILPDGKAEYPANLWDIKKWGKKQEYILHPSLKDLIFESPYRFYDHLIKTSARLFLENKTSELGNKCLAEFQDVCELVFITCTGKRLIMSRGKDLFNQEKEESVEIEWKADITE